ncbi:MAG: PRTRC system protein B [Flavobacteriia bacterium]|nr:PRTRC system protein B [Flavobacteriia bacterium]OJX36619.1 MAG: PRTRC system protein B [Flavobacteriia bacterium 40-80]
MNDITQDFGTLYYPKSALVFYQTTGKNQDTYVEHFDMDKNGMPVNAHPLTIREANRLAKALKTANEEKEPLLKPQGIMSSQILHFNPMGNTVIWFTKAMQRELYFTQSLGIPKGRASVPPMLWVADRNGLSVFALAGNRRPTERTKLYNAPFFNVYEDGSVCMGTVDIRIKKTASLEEFTHAWEGFFFNSYFSHLIHGYNPIKVNCVSLWESLITTGKAFPMEVLTRSNLTLKDIMR